MNRVSITEASNEQLIDIVRQLRKQLKDAKAAATQLHDPYAKELQDQITGFQGVLQEKNDEIQALRMQCRMLTEKSANDESTINTLLMRIEDLQKGEKFVAKDGATTSQRVEAGAPRGRSTALGGSDGPATTLARGESGTSNDATIASLSNQIASLSASVAAKSEKIVKLEIQVRELMEVNSFYSAIVSHHDREEREQKNARLASGRKRRNHADDGGETVEGTRTAELIKRVALLEDQRKSLQCVLRQVERERSALAAENQHHRGELDRLSGEMLEVERWQRVCKLAGPRCAAALTETSRCGAGGPGHQSAFVQNRILPERVPATVFSPSSTSPLSGPAGGRQAVAFSPLSNRSALSIGTAMRSGRAGSEPSGTPARPTSSSGRAQGTTMTLREIRALQPIDIRSPGLQERELLNRIRLYERHFAETEEFEADRRRSFDAMEKSRAELFANMNDQLEKQRRELHSLKKQLERSTQQESETSESLNKAARKTRDTVISSLLLPEAIDAGTNANLEAGEASRPVAESAEGEQIWQLSYERDHQSFIHEEEVSRLRLELSALFIYVAIAVDGLALVRRYLTSAAVSASSEVLAPVESHATAVYATPSPTTKEFDKGHSTDVSVETRTESDDPAVRAAPHPTHERGFLYCAKESHLGVAVETLMQMYGESLAALSDALRVEVDLPERGAQAHVEEADVAAILCALRNWAGGRQSMEPTDVPRGEAERRAAMGGEEDHRHQLTESVPFWRVSADPPLASFFPNTNTHEKGTFEGRHEPPSVAEVEGHSISGARNDSAAAAEAAERSFYAGRGGAGDDEHGADPDAGVQAEAWRSDIQPEMPQRTSSGTSGATEDAVSTPAEVDEATPPRSRSSLKESEESLDAANRQNESGETVPLLMTTEGSVYQGPTPDDRPDQDGAPGPAASEDDKAADLEHPDARCDTVPTFDVHLELHTVHDELGGKEGTAAAHHEEEISPKEEAELLRQLEYVVTNAEGKPPLLRHDEDDGDRATGLDMSVLAARAREEEEESSGQPRSQTGSTRFRTPREAEMDGSDTKAAASPLPQGSPDNWQTSSSSSRSTSSFRDDDDTTEPTRGPPRILSSTEDIDDAGHFYSVDEDSTASVKRMARVQTAEGFDAAPEMLSSHKSSSLAVGNCDFAADPAHLYSLSHIREREQVWPSNAGDAGLATAVAAADSASTHAKEEATPPLQPFAARQRTSFHLAMEATGFRRHTASSPSDEDNDGSGFHADFNPFA